MSLEDPGASSRKVQGIVAALAELERFHGGEALMQTAHYSATIRGHLAHLLRLADVTPDVLHSLAAVSDFSYGWGLLDHYAPRLQAQVGHLPRRLPTYWVHRTALENFHGCCRVPSQRAS